MPSPAIGAHVNYTLPNGGIRPATVTSVAADGSLTLFVHKFSRSDLEVPPNKLTPAIILGKDHDAPAAVIESVSNGTGPGTWHEVTATQATAAHPAAPVSASALKA